MSEYNSFKRSFANERRSISYRPTIAKSLDSVLAAILFQQVMYWSDLNENKPFYKFKEPCAHELYRETDSWTEELAFSRREFDTALGTIAVKLTKGQSRDEFPDALVYYWTDGDRVTWYEVNDVATEKWFTSVYLKAESADRVPKGGNALLVRSDLTAESAFIHTTEMNIAKDDLQPLARKNPDTGNSTPRDTDKGEDKGTRKPDGFTETPELKTAVATLLYGEDSDALWASPKSRNNMRQVLYRVHELQKAVGEDLKPEQLTYFGKWWMGTFMGRGGSKPFPSQVWEKWIECREKARVEKQRLARQRATVTIMPRADDDYVATSQALTGKRP